MAIRKNSKKSRGKKSNKKTKVKATVPKKKIIKALIKSVKVVKVTEQHGLVKKKKFEEKKEEVTVKKPALDLEEKKKVGTILADSGVRQRLIELGGENALTIIRNFYEAYSDEDISKKLVLKISDVRATLNKLHNEGIVNYIREKNAETGWYSYSWSLNVPRIEKWAGENILRPESFSDGQEYYFCAVCGCSSIVNFESAFGASFRCEKCEKPLEHIDENKMLGLYDKKKI